MDVFQEQVSPSTSFEFIKEQYNATQQKLNSIKTQFSKTVSLHAKKTDKHDNEKRY